MTLIERTPCLAREGAGMSMAATKDSLGSGVISALEKLAKEAVRFGLGPEELGLQPKAVSDVEYMKGWIGTIAGWDSPASFGCTRKHRARAQKAWILLIKKVTK